MLTVVVPFFSDIFFPCAGKCLEEGVDMIAGTCTVRETKRFLVLAPYVKQKRFGFATGSATVFESSILPQGKV